MLRWLGVVTKFTALTALVLIAFGTAQAEEFSLSQDCPPSFQKVEGICAFRSLYQLYPSLENQGVGGLKTGLPPIREGFSPQQIDLGRYLFFDPLLSGDGTVACASCHDPDKGFSDGRARSVGISGVPVKRSAPTLWNVGFLKRLFWDARADSLEAQMEGPLYDANEMGTTKEALLAALNNQEIYRELFAEAFGRSVTGDITLEEIYLAIAGFETSLISLNSRYDYYAHGQANALSDEEIEGLNVFRSFVARCAECHTPPLFTNQQIAVIGTPEPEEAPRDIGAEGPTQDPTLKGGFKVPSLRNVALTAPYMHSGRFETLEEVGDFYTKGRGHAVPDGEELYLHWHIWEPQLRPEEIKSVAAFLQTLTDESMKPKTPDAVPSGLSVGGGALD
ncbi:MAG: cytochrome-c peroxidase [Alphaproteobacteria bacterium]|nr:MAG: cytochrome-c peroxidase [Alphaproteobacteria bacterium]